MPEPSTITGGRIVISPDDPTRRRTWPDPRAAAEASWRAVYSPAALTREDLHLLTSVAGAYAYIFEVPQRTFLPSHAAIRAALAAPAVVPDPEETP